MRRYRTDQDDAHQLLLSWAAHVESALGSAYPPAPMTPTVQGDVAEFTRPERYADDQSGYEQLDRAVRRVGDIDPRLKGILWQQYVMGHLDRSGRADERRMAEEMGFTLRHWREWRDAARAAFIREYERVDPQGGVCYKEGQTSVSRA